MKTLIGAITLIPEPSPPSFQPRSAIGYFQTPPSKPKADLNFLDQMAGFKLSPGERAILGGLLVAALPALALGALAGCGRSLIPKAQPYEGTGGELCGDVICIFPNAISTCIEEKCRIAQCVRGFVDTNSIEGDGCECSEAAAVCVQENRPPVLEPIGSRNVNVGQELRFSIQARDADGNSLHYGAIGLPAGASLNETTGEFTWIPSAEQVRIHDVIFTVSDGRLTDSETVNIEVRGVREILETQITRMPSGATSPTLIWAEGEYGVFWIGGLSGAQTVFFTKIGTDGRRIGADVQIFEDVSSVSAAWTGSGYGVCWITHTRAGVNEIYFTQTDPFGNRVGVPLRVTGHPDLRGYSIAWNGRNFGISWSNSNDIYLTQISGDGRSISSGIQITTDDSRNPKGPSLIWADGEFGISWMDERHGVEEIYFARVNGSGRALGGNVRITKRRSNKAPPRLVWTGDEYGVTWVQSTSGGYQVHFAWISRVGEKIGSDMVVSGGLTKWTTVPSLVWTGSEYGVSWCGPSSPDSSAASYEIYFARLDPEGNELGNDVRVTNDYGESRAPSLAWNGREYGICWHDSRRDYSQIYCARISGVFGR